MPQLSLVLLGSFEATVQTEGRETRDEVRLPTDKTRALLAYLALSPETALRREALAALLWPDQEEGRARQNLRKTLARLRKALDAAAPGLAGALLAVTRQTVTLHEATCASDVTRLRELQRVAAGHAHGALWQCAACLARLEECAALLQKGELLAGFSLPDAALFETWLREEREQLHHVHLETLQLLAEAYEQQGAGEPAMGFARRQIALEPWREEGHRQLMRLLARQGQRGEAIAQYQRCRQILREELDVEPAPETEALLGQIMDGALPPQRMAASLTPAPLPQPAQPLIGRRSDIDAVLKTLGDPDCRLVTLIGPGGMGKTSLAVAVAQDWAQEERSAVAFVRLADVASAEQLPAVVAEALGLALQSRSSIAGQVATFLRQKRLLLILDNVESVHAADAWLQSLSAGSPHLKVLATARAALNWLGEWRYPLHGLSCSPEAAGGAAHPPDAALPSDAAPPPEAVALFVQAAQRVRPGFRLTAENGEAVLRICRLVQGWPLALQMAAGWLRMMNSEGIAEQIGESLDFLTSTMRDIPARQQSIRAVFEHTWQALDEEERAVLAKLSVFRGGFTRHAAEKVAGANPFHLLGLVDRSLLQVDAARERYGLHPLLQQFAAEKATMRAAMQAVTPAGSPGGELQETEQQHAAYYLNAVKEWGARLKSVEYAAALENIRQDLRNVRVAWLRAASGPGMALLPASVEPLATYFERSGLAQEGVTFFREALALPASATRREAGQLQAQVAYYLAYCLRISGQYAAAVEAVRQAQALARENGDVALVNRALIQEAEIEREQGAFERALAMLQEAIAYSQAQDEPASAAQALRVQGNTFWSLGAYERAEACYVQAREIQQRLGQEETAAILTGNIGTVYWKRGRPAEALRRYEVALAARRRMGDASSVALWLGNIGLLYVDMKEDEQALQYLDEALAMHTQLGRQFYKIELLLGKTKLYLRRGDLKAAQTCHQQALDIAQEIGNRAYLLDCDLWQARLLRREGRAHDAMQLLQLLLVREFRPNVKGEIFEELSGGGGRLEVRDWRLEIGDWGLGD